MPKYFHLAYQSFGGKILRPYFNTSIIINAFATAFILWIPILLEYFLIEFWVLHVIIFFIGFGRLLTHNKHEFFWTGAFTGLLWFHWISWSFIHYGFSFLIPLGIIGIMLVYGFLFWLCGIWHSHPLIKSIALLGLGFVAPFGFNWFDWRLFLVDTPFRVDMVGVGLCMSAIVLFVSIQNRWRWLSILILIFALETDLKKIEFLPNDIEIANTNIPQSQKWNPDFLSMQINNIFERIEESIAKKEALIIFPESAFPLYLNHNEMLRQTLLGYSHKINIIVGALTHTNEGIYNSSYFYHNGQESVAHKVILVPFGEQVPLPKFMRDLITQLFYGGASDFLTSKNPQHY